ncbi:hypothetical protein [Duncaniella muris]|uniref:hypothetical protein n=1 Tax=Duncaniella muris TaxID=2094150 RepID=UPI0026E06DC9|nr:hypothetical protein [Duncaniella muris]
MMSSIVTIYALYPCCTVSYTSPEAMKVLPAPDGPMYNRQNEKCNLDAKAVTTQNASIEKLATGMSSVKDAFGKMSDYDPARLIKEASEASAKQMLKDMSDKFDTAVLKAQLQQKNPGITGNDMTSINTNLREINEGLANLNDCAGLRKWNKILMIVVTVLSVISAGTVYWVKSLRSERDELVKVEWLYRYVRPSIRNPNTLADVEARMFDGTDEQRDSIKSDAFTRETNGLPFRSFTPHDDWKPKPPEPEKTKTKSEEEDSGGWFDWITRKTPQEEAALRDVRNNPNIPEGAKP